MKKMILFVFISCVMSVFVSAQDFRTVMVPGIEPINGGCRVDANTLFLTGSLHTIYKSTDNGNTWLKKFTLDTTAFAGWDISFGSTTTGYAVGAKGRIAKSSDGGETWNLILTPDTTFVMKAVKFFDANNGYVLGVKSPTSNLYQTTDGGTTWTTATTISGTLEQMDFYSATKGILVGGGTAGMLLYYTTDGTTWTKAATPTIPPYGYTKLNLHTIKFVTETLAYGCGWGSFVGMQPAIFVKTTDGGVTWSYLDQASQNRIYANVNTLYFKDELNGIAAGNYSYPGTIIAKTTDGGLNWVPSSVPAGFDPSALLGNGDNLILSGGGGNVLVSTDFGISWINKNRVPKATLYTIKIKNNKIFSAGYESYFFKSEDNGNSFTSSSMQNGNVCLRPNDLSFVNENTGFAAMMYGQVLKTIDGGMTWNEALPDTYVTSRANNGIYFLDENKGFVAGALSSNVDVIYKTTDGGATWSSKSNLVFKNLNCISFADDNHGAAGGNSAKILFTTDQGNNWYPSVVNFSGEPNIKDINFLDPQNGIAVGDRAILKTTDAGASWNSVTVSFLDKILESVVYKDANTVYAGGDKYLLKSTDAGNTWSIIGDTAYYKVNRINSLDIDQYGYLWIATSMGIILTNSPYNGIDDAVLDPNSFVLEQNYPNPFNPTTTIAFRLSDKGFVTLKLFDVLGREVKEIFKGEMAAGKHSIIFNASALASGTYIYSLQVNNQFTGRKMTLIK